MGIDRSKVDDKQIIDLADTKSYQYKVLNQNRSSAHQANQKGEEDKKNPDRVKWK